MQSITPFLWLDNKAEEAARFYVSIFKDGKLGDISHYGDEGPGEPGSVMVAEFSILGMDFLARCGLSWQVVPTILGESDEDEEKSGRVMAAMMEMKKLDIAALRRAYDGSAAATR